VVAIDEPEHSSADLGARPPSLALRGEDRQLFRQALEHLSREYREVILWRELVGLTSCGPKHRSKFASKRSTL
jgi:DNA-directed RNA polymerase specialized sigma24 family protein